MKWLVLAWFFRRDIWTGWKRGVRRNRLRRTLTQAAGMPMLTEGTPLQLPGWIDRPIEAPEWSDAAIRRFYGDWKSA